MGGPPGTRAGDNVRESHRGGQDGAQPWGRIPGWAGDLGHCKSPRVMPSGSMWLSGILRIFAGFFPRGTHSSLFAIAKQKAWALPLPSQAGRTAAGARGCGSKQGRGSLVPAGASTGAAQHMCLGRQLSPELHGYSHRPPNAWEMSSRLAGHNPAGPPATAGLLAFMQSGGGAPSRGAAGGRRGCAHLPGSASSGGTFGSPAARGMKPPPLAGCPGPRAPASPSPTCSRRSGPRGCRRSTRSRAPARTSLGGKKGHGEGDGGHTTLA